MEVINVDGTKKMFRYQKDIGCILSLDGYLSHEWVQVHQLYLEWIGSRNSGKRWAVVLICKLWEIEWDAW